MLPDNISLQIYARPGHVVLVFRAAILTKKEQIQTYINTRNNFFLLIADFIMHKINKIELDHRIMEIER